MTTLLIDADIVAYKVACVHQTKYDFNGDGAAAVALDKAGARRKADALIEEYAKATKATGVVICLTDPHMNWRKDVDPTYKENRTSTEKPVMLEYVKTYLAEEYESFVRPTLEADDIMGILATHHRLYPDSIIVSEDKDLRTIPARVYNPNYPQLGVLDISRLDADRFHMWQTVCGDPTDGYAGAKGVGKKSWWAEEIIEADREDLWDLVLNAFLSVDMTREDANKQARMARILRAEDYDMKTKTIHLWTPECLNRE